MKISTKARYAVRCMCVLAASKETISVSEISKQENISERYLELIFSKLKEAELINSIRGSKGGYQISRPAESITVYDIVHAVEDDLNIIKDSDGSSDDDDVNNILVTNVWNAINREMAEYFKGITLSSIIE